MEVNLQIPGIKSYNKDVLLLVIPTMTYSKTVPVMVGTKKIDKALSLMTMGELAKATMTWRQAAETNYPAQKGWVLEDLDLQGLKEWPESEQKTGQGALAQMGASVHTQ